MNFCFRTDSGLYNCVATRSYGSNYNYNRGRRESVYMDILVSPRSEEIMRTWSLINNNFFTLFWAGTTPVVGSTVALVGTTTDTSPTTTDTTTGPTTPTPRLTGTPSSLTTVWLRRTRTRTKIKNEMSSGEPQNKSGFYNGFSSSIVLLEINLITVLITQIL